MGNNNCFKETTAATWETAAAIQAQRRFSESVGAIPVTSRYHRASSKTIEDDYVVCNKVLGSGYNGVVRLAMPRGRSNGQKFAVKAFKLSNVPQDRQAQLVAEMEIFLKVDHPHITRLVDVYESDAYLHLVMECMEGGELFDRVTKLQRFGERDAAEACYQMLLALNYIHCHGIVHRDIKMENFLYDAEGSNHLKLIDFGFSKVWDPNVKMQACCGTLSYVAPEVLQGSYGDKCDIWSLGVIVFVLLSGYMPFSGDEREQISQIAAGDYVMKKQRWCSISEQAKNFVVSLLQVNPENRLSAEAALEHDWISQRQNHTGVVVDALCVDALRRFGQASKFRRCCMEVMAWSLSNEDCAEVRQYFISMDQDRRGTITLPELKKVLIDQYQLPDDETRQIFASLDSNSDEVINYSDFLAAMLSSRIALHDDLLRNAFKKFDTDGSGEITIEKLRVILGGDPDGPDVERMISEADFGKDGKISYAEFVSFLRGDALEGMEGKGDIMEMKRSKTINAAALLIDKHLSDEKDAPGVTRHPSWRKSIFPMRREGSVLSPRVKREAVASL